MVATWTRLLPDGLIAGEVRVSADTRAGRRWVDLHPGALVRLGVQVGDRVMVECAGGDSYPATIQHDGERVAVLADVVIEHHRVLVRRRGFAG